MTAKVTARKRPANSPPGGMIREQAEAVGGWQRPRAREREQLHEPAQPYEEQAAQLLISYTTFLSAIDGGCTGEPFCYRLLRSRGAPGARRERKTATISAGGLWNAPQPKAPRTTASWPWLAAAQRIDRTFCRVRASS